MGPETVSIPKDFIAVSGDFHEVLGLTAASEVVDSYFHYRAWALLGVVIGYPKQIVPWRIALPCGPQWCPQTIGLPDRTTTCKPVKFEDSYVECCCWVFFCILSGFVFFLLFLEYIATKG